MNESYDGVPNLNQTFDATSETFPEAEKEKQSGFNRTRIVSCDNLNNLSPSSDVVVGSLNLVPGDLTISCHSTPRDLPISCHSTAISNLAEALESVFTARPHNTQDLPGSGSGKDMTVPELTPSSILTKQEMDLFPFDCNPGNIYLLL